MFKFKAMLFFVLIIMVALMVGMCELVEAGGVQLGPQQTNTQLQNQNQNQGQLQGQGQNQSVNNSDSIIIEGNEREYPITADPKFGNSPSGFWDSSKDSGRKFFKTTNQFLFGGKTRSVKVAKKMLENYSYWATTAKSTVKIMPMVSIGDYPETYEMTVATTVTELNKLRLNLSVIAIGQVFSNTKAKHGNSSILTNKTIIGGCGYGATHFVPIRLGVERNFKHRSAGGGGGIVDGSNGPDTVISFIASLFGGRQSYDKEPYQIGWLVRVPPVTTFGGEVVK